MGVLDAVGIQFCNECNNMLYPREDKVNRALLYQCRNCDLSVDADRPCIYVNKLISTRNEVIQINTDVVQDPTLPTTNHINCPQCNAAEAVFFQSYSTRKDAKMNLFYVCKVCRHKWTCVE